MLELVRRHPRYGYRRIWALLRAEGFKVNRKRVHRLWKREGLKVPQKQHKKRRLGTSDNGIVRRRALHKDHVWAWDFIHDRTEDGRALKWLSVVDEYTRECLVLEVRRSFTSGDVIDVLRELLVIRGTPMHIRSDNGPEFIAKTICSWLSSARVETCTSSRERRGRTATPRASTVVCATSCWRASCSPVWRKRRC